MKNFFLYIFYKMPNGFRNLRVGKRRRTNRKKKSIAQLRKKQRDANIRSICKSVISRRVENKHMTPLAVNDYRVLHDLTDPTLQLIPLMPQISQGDGQGNRTGNAIMTMRSVFYVNINAIQFTATPSIGPIYFDMYIFKFKKTNTQSAVQLDKFLQYGNTAINYQGGTIPQSYGLTVNKDLFTIKRRRRILLWNPKEPMDYAGSSRVLNAKSFKFDITNAIKKKLKYSDDISYPPTNDNLFFMCGFTCNDGRNLGSAVAGNVETLLTYEFEDA